MALFDEKKIAEGFNAPDGWSKLNLSQGAFLRYEPPYGRVTVSEGALSLILGWLLEKEKPEQVQRAIDALNNDLFYRT